MQVVKIDLKQIITFSYQRIYQKYTNIPNDNFHLPNAQKYTKYIPIYQMKISATKHEKNIPNGNSVYNVLTR